MRYEDRSLKVVKKAMLDGFEDIHIERKPLSMTIAVLGNGLDICYPSEHRILMENIAKQGLLISEYESGIKPQKVYFPRRNRIIAAFSDEIIIISAGKGSGALITAQYGEKYHRKIWIITNDCKSSV